MLHTKDNKDVKYRMHIKTQQEQLGAHVKTDFLYFLNEDNIQRGLTSKGHTCANQ